MLKHLCHISIFLVTFLSFSAFADCVHGNDVLAKLNCLPGVKAKELIPTSALGYRTFELKVTQETDHFAPTGETFEQRVVLLHKNWNEPMVLQTSGYAIFGISLSRLASTFGTNQIQIEHRYFQNSTPKSNDLSKLNIRQSAADFHHVTELFKTLYTQRWVGTGGSKGGMTSTYHKAFYPDDLDGTVADVAPLSFARDDSRQRYPKISGSCQKTATPPYPSPRKKVFGCPTTLLVDNEPLPIKV